eukprot:364234-Chlamydomonas_euryale.AAC.2
MIRQKDPWQSCACRWDQCHKCIGNTDPYNQDMGNSDQRNLSMMTHAGGGNGSGAQLWGAQLWGAQSAGRAHRCGRHEHVPLRHIACKLREALCATRLAVNEHLPLQPAADLRLARQDVQQRRLASA